MIKKKKTTKYELTRKDIVADLEETICALEEIDCRDMSANDLNSTICGIVAELSTLSESIARKAR